MKNNNNPNRIPLVIYLDERLYRRISTLLRDFDNATLNDIISICVRKALPKLETTERIHLSKINKKDIKRNDSKSN